MSLFSKIKNKTKRLFKKVGNVAEKVVSNPLVQTAVVGAGAAYGVPPQASGGFLSLFGDDEPIASPVPMAAPPPTPPTYFLPQPPPVQSGYAGGYINAPLPPRSVTYAGAGVGATQCAAATGEAWLTLPEFAVTVAAVVLVVESIRWGMRKCSRV